LYRWQHEQDQKRLEEERHAQELMRRKKAEEARQQQEQLEWKRQEELVKRVEEEKRRAAEEKRLVEQWDTEKMIQVCDCCARWQVRVCVCKCNRNISNQRGTLIPAPYRTKAVFTVAHTAAVQKNL